MQQEGFPGGNSPRYKGPRSNFSPMSPPNFNQMRAPFDHPMTPPPFYYAQHGAGCSSPRFSTPNIHHNSSSSSDSSPQQRHFAAYESQSPNADFMRIDRSGSDFGRGRNHPIRSWYRPWPFRSRRYHSPRHGHQDQARFRSPLGSPGSNKSVEIYVKPSFLEDPWAELLKKRIIVRTQECDNPQETSVNDDTNPSTNQHISPKS